MPEYQAEVTPRQSWNEDGRANVIPMPPYPNTTPRILPLKNHAGGDLTVLRSQYPGGLVVIPVDSPPHISPAVLPMRPSSEEQISIENDDHVDWPDGVVAWFTD